ncbi:MAG: hypothetical protein LUQ33_07980 [Methanoregulaceae archaeon]|nr:hypothetical protein [Methanoregulaceae archaeon]
MKTRHLVILIAVVLGIVLAAPVSAYSISVTSGTSDPIISSQLQSMIAGIKVTQPQSSAFDILSQAGTNSGASQGSVTAYSDGMFQDQNSLIRFKESVSVSGIINQFSYSANFNSALIR